MRDLVYYVATSLDGFIADPTGDSSRFPTAPETLAALFDRYPETCPTHLRPVVGVEGDAARFDTVLMGRRTYEPAVAAGLPGGAYPHLRQIVVTRGSLDAVETMAGDVAEQVVALKGEPGRDIWLCGGAELAGQLVAVIDEIQVKLNPVLLGEGIPLFAGGMVPESLVCVEVTPLPGGVVLATYRTGGVAPG